MFEPSLELLSINEQEILAEIFTERARDNTIFFYDFKDILYSFDKFESPCLGELLEKVKKKLKERYSGFTDSELTIS
jgi:hypothetical protein